MIPRHIFLAPPTNILLWFSHFSFPEIEATRYTTGGLGGGIRDNDDDNDSIEGVILPTEE